MVKEGDQCNKIYIVRSGEFKMSVSKRPEVTVDNDIDEDSENGDIEKRYSEVLEQ